MSSLLSAELSATCNALGTLNKKTGKYMIDDFTLNTVKDLIRYLRRDGEDHEIRRHFGQTKVLQTDLLPMLIDHWENEELFDVTLRLIVNLTNPALLLYREEVPVERTARHNYLQILSHLQSYKEDAFTKVETWQIFAKKLGKVLEIDWSERDEDTGLVIERILILIRNVLHVPADLDKERRPENDASVHDQVLWALNQAGILDIILYMSSENEKQYFMHIIEIISHLLREQNPTSLADSALQRSVDEKLRDDQQLLTLRMTENKDRMNKIKHYSATRHSRFGGTYVVQNMKSISDNELISLKPLNKISNLDFNGSRKSRLVRPKNRRPVESGAMERRSAFAIRLFLKEFCIEFLNSAYNPLMRHVRDVLARAAAQQHDDSYYLWAVKFFMEFNRGHDFQVGLVSETMSVPMFHYVQQQTEKYYDMIKVERKKFSNWVRRLHLAVRAYKELLLSVVRMEQGSAELRDAAKVFKTNIFYVLEYREFVLSIFLNYDENKMPRSYLVDLIETVHLFLKMLEHYCKKTGLVVQKKVRKKTNAKKRKSKPRARVPSPPSWEELRPQLSAVLSSGCALRPPPCDFADAHDDLQKERCMRNIQQLMRQHKYEHAVGTLRAAREVWPEGGVFGADGMREEEELDMLQCVYAADLGLDTHIQDEEIHENSEEEENEDEEDEDRTTSVVETDFDFQDFVLRFCSYRVVSSCASVLERYESNPPHANHCALKMLHRVAVDCCRPAMLFQATLFLTFQKILQNPLAHFKELEKFAIFILRKFTEVASKSSKAFIELLFWKSSKDAVEIQHGYNLYEDPRSKVGSGGWSEEQEHELRALYDENQTNPATDQDVIDWILENLIDQTRTRRSVIKKLREMGLVFNAPTKRSNKERKEKPPTHFSEEEDQALTDLWTQYGESEDPMSAIVAGMPRSRPRRQYVERLVELGLVEDKKQCRRKRTRNKTNGNSSDSELSKSDSEGPSTPVPPSLKTKPRKKLTKRKETNKKSAVSVEISAREVAALLVRAVDSGYTEALNWLSENLEEVALDQEAEGFDPSAEGTPLVPITRGCVQAMRDDLFTRVCRSVGMVPPDNEQETYWRIPSSLHHETIRTRRDIINRAVNRELITDHTSALTERDKENNIDERNSTAAPTERNKEDIIDERDSTAAPTERDKEDIIDERDSTSDDELFDNLRKITNNAHDDNIKNKRRKRSRSDRSWGDQHTPMERIEEEHHEEEEDILSFAKKTLHTDEQRDSDASEGEAPRKRKKMRVLSDSE